MNGPWQIELLGELQVRQHDRTITRFRTHKAALLLACLAYPPYRPHPRDELAELLWPESEPSAARLNLRVELASLRRQLEPPGVPQGAVLRADHAVVELNPLAISTDVFAFQTAVQEAEKTEDQDRRISLLRRAVELYRGELLPGCYDDWVLWERSRLADRYLSALRELVCLLHGVGDLDVAIEYAHRAVAADPLSEEAHFDLIRLYASANRPADAVRQYHELEQILREELDGEPSEAIRRFAASLMSPAAPASVGMRGTNPQRRAAPGPAASLVTHPRAADAASAAQPAGPALPLTFTRFFGQEAELARLQALLEPGSKPARAGARLVTLTGPGGSGKTRLAIEAAKRLSPSFEQAVWFVPLADLLDGARIVDALADALHLARSPGLDPLEQAVTVLAPRPCLLILDNLEHLLDAGRDLLRKLLQQAPALVCLVTSRQRLDLEGEREIPVLPLPIPVASGQWSVPSRSSDDGPTLATGYWSLTTVPSVQLFIDRAQAARPDFQITPRNAVAVASLCAHLEGIPLAIELAAAWAQTLTPAQMVAELERGYSLLVSRGKDTLPRHHSLHTAIEWSYRLLDSSLQRFFAQLAVFRGGWDLEAAQSVCDEPDALARIAALRDRSLVVAEEHGEVMRYRLLEPIRHFARARLGEDEWQELVQRHTTYYLLLAEAPEPGLYGEQQKTWAGRLNADSANLQAALEHSGRREEGLRLAAALAPFWQLRGELRQGLDWLERMLAANPKAPPALRAKALFSAAALAYLAGDPARAEALCDAGFGLRERLSSQGCLGEVVRPLTTPLLVLNCPDASQGQPRLLEVLQLCQEEPRVRAFLLARQARQARIRGEYAAAAELHERSLAIYRELGDWQGVAVALNLRSELAHCQSDYAAARQYREESLAVYRKLDDQFGICQLTAGLGYAICWQGDLEQGERLLEESLALSRRIGSRHDIAGCLWVLGNVACCHRQYDRAVALLEESLAIRRQMGVPSDLADPLVTLGMTAEARGDLSRARAAFEEAITLRRQGADKLDLAEALTRLGLVALAQGGCREAEGLLQEGLELAQQMRNDTFAAQALRGLGLVACRTGNLPAAEERLRDCLAPRRAGMETRGKAEGLEALAELRARQERAEEATALYAVADAIRASIGSPIPPGAQPGYTRALAALRRALGAEQFAAIWQEARRISPDEALMNPLEPGG